MGGQDVVDGAAVMAVLDELAAGYNTLARLRLDALSTPELQAVGDRLETLRSRHPAVEHRLLHELRQRTSPHQLGATSWAAVLSTRLRISTGEARRRLAEADQVGPRAALIGEPLDPALPRLAAAQACGQVNAEHVRIIGRFFDHLPHWVDTDTRAHAEAQLVAIACGFKPEELRAAAERLRAMIDQDGEFPRDADRARKRCVRIGRQGVDGMTPITGVLDPEARATLDAVLAKWAAPGMCNPDDDTPCVDGDPSEAVADRDMRSQAQRNHDALKAMGRSVLASGQLGQHNGLPATIIVSTTLPELESGHGQAVTGGGSLLPMSDAIRLASHAHHYLVIYDRHTQQPLYLGRTKRLASAAQRIVLHAKDRGCSFPGCPVPGYGCQVHHAECDWATDGHTDITDLTLACGPHNRLVKPGGWRTRKRHDGYTEWIPPPHLDTGQTRVNNYHHPERYLIDPDEE
jgi:hypothetical protein